MYQKFLDRRPLSEYVEFVKSTVSRSDKTEKFFVMSKKHKDMLGEIHWYSPWRQYVFFPDNALFNRTCLRDIAGFLDELMRQRKLVWDPQ